jgi:large subunit ribosomal protein L3
MKFIIGYKQEMTQKYREDGTIVPVTVVKAEPAIVTQVKTAEKEGYNAIQLGIGERNKVGKAMTGHIKPLEKGNVKPFHRLREIRVEDASQFTIGDTINVKTFEAGDKVAVTGTSKGKGFQGVVKRHGFGGSPATHGHKDQLRMPGSIGSQDPQRVFKGTRMGGRTGGKQITVKNLEVVAIDEENNQIYVKGALPGARNSLILVMGEGDLAKGLSVFETEPEKKEEPAPETKEEASSDQPAEEEKKEAAPAEQDKNEEKAEEKKEESTKEEQS